MKVSRWLGGPTCMRARLWGALGRGGSWMCRLAVPLFISTRECIQIRVCEPLCLTPRDK